MNKIILNIFLISTIWATIKADNRYDQTVIVPSYASQIRSVAMTKDGNIVAGGYTDSSTGLLMALAKYNNTGGLVKSFGSNGIVTTSASTGSQILGITVDSQGDIVAAGYSVPGRSFVLAKYHADGSLVSSFGTNGIVTGILAGTTLSWFAAITVDIDDNIYVSGLAAVRRKGGVFLLAKYDKNGVLVPSFGINGVALLQIGASNYSFANSIAIDAENNIVLGGGSLLGSTYNAVLAKYDKSGSLITSFGSGGTVVWTTFTGQSSPLSATLVDENSNIYAGGYAKDNSGKQTFALTKYDKNGSLVNSFGVNGVVLTNMSALYPPNNGALTLTSAIRGLVFGYNGSIVAVGLATSVNSYQLNALAIYASDGTLKSYSVDAISGGTAILASAVLNDNIIYAGGYSTINSLAEFTMNYYSGPLNYKSSFSKRLIEKYSNKA